MQPEEVSQFRWKKLGDRSDEVRYSKGEKGVGGRGYAEGHLKFLEIVRGSAIGKGKKEEI